MSIPKFKKLTKETNGKIYEWQVKINKINDEHYEILTLNGYSDGKKAEHKVDIKKGKAGRTVLEQALETSQNLIKRKRIFYYNFKPMSVDKVKVDLYTGKSKSRAFRIEFPAYATKIRWLKRN